MATVTVEVTRDRIAAGVPGQCDVCPIALAVMAVVAEGVSVSVGDDTIDLSLPGEDEPHSILTPDDAERFIADFDSSQPVAPFTFDLDIPDRYLAPAAVRP